jgi:penicillin-binding protein 1A
VSTGPNDTHSPWWGRPAAPRHQVSWAVGRQEPASPVGGDPGGPGGPGAPPSGPPPEPPQRPRIRLRWLRLLALLIPIGALAVVSLVFGMMMAVSRELPDLDTAREFQSAKNTVLYDRNGRTMGILADSSRHIVSSKQISSSMTDAVVAMEDERFWSNSGVDFRGIGRAVVQDVIERRAAQGASTITQQLIKMSLEAQSDRSVFQKLREAALAFHMTRQWSKTKILTNYLNRVYFGNGAHGVESAAKTYFGKRPDHEGCGMPQRPCALNLTPAESALLTAIIASPTMYDPVTEPAAALRRRDQVLRKMLEQKRIDRLAFEEARAEPLPSRDEIEPPTLDTKNPYFASWVGAQLIDRYGAQRTYEGGLKVTTTIDQAMQDAAERTIKTFLPDRDGPRASLVAIDNRTGEVRAMVGGDDYSERPFNLATQGQRQPGSSFKPFVLAQALRQGVSPDSVWSSKKLSLRVKDEKGRTETFRVTNSESAYSGQTTLARALTWSDNAVFAQVGQKVGTKPIAKLIERMGIRTPVSSNAAVVLGAPRRGVTVLDMAHAFETFATRGLRIEGSLGAPNGGPVGITKVDTGKRVIKNKVERKRVISTGVADNATAIMQTVVSTGTGKRAQYGGYAAGKTGTTENNADAWFVGFSKDITVAVWVGYPDSGKPMQTEYNGEPVEGGTYPAAIWGQFQRAVAAIYDRRAKSGKHKAPTGTDVPIGKDEGADGGGDADGDSGGDAGTGSLDEGTPVAGGSSSGSSGGNASSGGGSSSGGSGGGSGGGTGGQSGSSATPAPQQSTQTPAPSTGAGSSGAGSGSGSGSGSAGGSGATGDAGGSAGGGSSGGAASGAVPLE